MSTALVGLGSEWGRTSLSSGSSPLYFADLSIYSYPDGFSGAFVLAASAVPADAGSGFGGVKGGLACSMRRLV